MSDTPEEIAQARAEAYRCPCVGTNDPRCMYPDCPEGADEDT